MTHLQLDGKTLSMENIVEGLCERNLLDYVTDSLANPVPPKEPPIQPAQQVEGMDDIVAAIVDAARGFGQQQSEIDQAMMNRQIENS